MVPQPQWTYNRVDEHDVLHIGVMTLQQNGALHVVDLVRVGPDGWTDETIVPHALPEGVRSRFSQMLEVDMYFQSLGWQVARMIPIIEPGDN